MKAIDQAIRNRIADTITRVDADRIMTAHKVAEHVADDLEVAGFMLGGLASDDRAVEIGAVLQVSGKYGAEAVEVVYDVLVAARQALPCPAIRSLPGQQVVPDARERLARHLFLADAGNPETWDGLAAGSASLAAYNTASGSRIRMEGADVLARFYAEADAILAVISGEEG